MNEAQGIRTFFASLGEGIKKSGEWRAIFDFMRDNLRKLEAKGDGKRSLRDLVLIGEIKMACDVLSYLKRWPDKGTLGYEERYAPRVDKLYKAAMIAKPPPKPRG